MTRISNYSVGLSLNTQGFAEGAGLARRDMAQLTRELRDAQTPMERYSRSLDTIEKGYRSGALDMAQYNRLLAEQKRKLDEATQAAERHSRASGAGGIVNGALGGMGLGGLMGGPVGLAAAGGAALVGMASWAVSLAEELKRSQLEFGVLLNSQREANRMIEDMRALANATPLDFGGISKAGKTLLQFGIDSKQVVSLIREMGDITMGSQEKLEGLAYQFGQVSARGRLTTEDLNSMSDRGFNPLTVMAKGSIEEFTRLREEMERGGISINMVTEALHEQAKARQGLMEKSGNTAYGQWSMFYAETGEALTKPGMPMADFLETEIKQARASLALLQGDIETANRLWQGSPLERMNNHINENLLRDLSGVHRYKDMPHDPAEMQRIDDLTEAGKKGLADAVQSQADMYRDANIEMARAHEEARQAEDRMEADRKELHENEYGEAARKAAKEYEDFQRRKKEEHEQNLERLRDHAQQELEKELEGKISEGEKRQRMLSNLQQPAAASEGSAEAYKAITARIFAQQKEDLKKNDPQVKELKVLQNKLDMLREDMKQNRVARLRN